MCCEESVGGAGGWSAADRTVAGIIHSNKTMFNRKFIQDTSLKLGKIGEFYLAVPSDSTAVDRGATFKKIPEIKFYVKV